MSRWLFVHSAEILRKINQRILITLQKKGKIVLLNTSLADGKLSLVAMNATCPHSGGPLELGVLEDFDIEDLEKNNDACRGKVLVCPWHSYRFDIRSGKSIDDDIFTAQVYPVKIEDGSLYIECSDYDEIEDVTLFEVPSVVSVPDSVEEIFTRIDLSSDISAKEMMEALVGKSLFDWCICILTCEDAQKKVALTIALKEKWHNNEIKEIKKGDQKDQVPDRPARNKSLQFVDPSKVKKRGKGNSVASRITILHALANVEQWAIDLAIDIMVRFSDESFQSHDGTIFTLREQREFFTDFIKVASDEARHFTYLVERLNALGADYGDLPCHQGLWDSALDTKDSLMARLAIVHMVHEARGLDVNPQTIEKFRRAGDLESVDKLEQIHQDEITHVATGQRWFAWCCSVMNIDRYQTFHGHVKKHFWGYLKPPFNEKDRDRAGLDPQYYKPLTEEAEEGL